jgi:hypothetical protein
MSQEHAGDASEPPHMQMQPSKLVPAKTTVLTKLTMQALETVPLVGSGVKRSGVKALRERTRCNPATSDEATRMDNWSSGAGEGSRWEALYRSGGRSALLSSRYAAPLLIEFPFLVLISGCAGSGILTLLEPSQRCSGGISTNLTLGVCGGLSRRYRGATLTESAAVARSQMPSQGDDRAATRP